MMNNILIQYRIPSVAYLVRLWIFLSLLLWIHSRSPRLPSSSHPSGA